MKHFVFPFVATSSTACSRAWWAQPGPTLENLGQIADGLGLNAVLMQLPSPHLGRLSLPAVLEIPEAEGLVLVTGSATGRLVY